MKKVASSKNHDDLRPEYDLSRLAGGVRGKYARKCREGTNLVRLAPDVAVAFPTDQAVNQALRMLLNLSQKVVR